MEKMQNSNKIIFHSIKKINKSYSNLHLIVEALDFFSLILENYCASSIGSESVYLYLWVHKILGASGATDFIIDPHSLEQN